MRKLSLTLIAALTALPLFAQLGGDGYYRLQNKNVVKSVGTGRYISIVNNKIDDTNKSSIQNGGQGSVYSMKTIANPISDPGTIIYISKDGKGYNFEAQGINPLSFLQKNNIDFKIYDKGNNAYWLYATYSGTTRYLADNSGSDGYINVVGSGERNKDYAFWYIKPIDNSTEYFGITPDFNIGDKYYTTLYAAFPFQLSAGMKAYYVSQFNIGSQASVQAAELMEITSGQVPASTPVIIECSSADPAQNKVTLIDKANAPAAIKGNKLTGIYFAYVKMKATGTGENTSADDLKNVTSYNSSTMRVLGVANGQLALVPATDDQLLVTDRGKYLPANKAYLTINASAAAATASGISLMNSDAYAAGIQTIEADEKVSKPGIYTLTGIRLRETNNQEGLPNGVYIIDGKKTIVK